MIVQLPLLAESKLSRFGRVVFGLREEEVGHIYPQWTGKEGPQYYQIWFPFIINVCMIIFIIIIDNK